MLLQEILVKRSPWHMLVGCCLLNLTTRAQADKAWPELFEIWPDPETAARHGKIAGSTRPGRLRARELLKPLGMGNRRFKTIIKLSETYLAELDRVGYDLNSVDLDNVYGCGQYAKDSWRLFVLGESLDWREVGDKELKKWCRKFPSWARKLSS